MARVTTNGPTTAPPIRLSTEDLRTMDDATLLATLARIRGVREQVFEKKSASRTATREAKGKSEPAAPKLEELF